MSAALAGVTWIGDWQGHLQLLDQTRLPRSVTYLEIYDIEQLREAILRLAVRGAPAIGIAAAYGVALHASTMAGQLGHATRADQLEDEVVKAIDRLGSSRPTAVNLHWALRRQRECFERHSDMLNCAEVSARLWLEAKRIHEEDRALCQAIADNGARLLPAGGIYTHCNTGALATGGVGTALGCILTAAANGTELQVYAGETRPLLQGARLTATELLAAKVPVTLCSDTAAGSLMARGKIQAVIVGADRIALNGDTANKIGTYQLAIMARHHHIPFYVAAPYSTFDLSLIDGTGIEIEERPAEEVRSALGQPLAPDDVPVANPAFDVTPSELITAIITERGVIDTPTPHRVRTLMDDADSIPAF